MRRDERLGLFARAFRRVPVKTKVIPANLVSFSAARSSFMLTQRILIAYDRDAPGERAAGELAQRLMMEGIACARVQFPKGMDANDYARKVQPAAKSLGLAIRQAVWIGNGAPAAVPAAMPDSRRPWDCLAGVGERARVGRVLYYKPLYRNISSHVPLLMPLNMQHC